MNIFKLCAAILQDFGHPKNRCWHTQLNVCEKEGFPCFLYLIQIFDAPLFRSTRFPGKQIKLQFFAIKLKIKTYKWIDFDALKVTFKVDYSLIQTDRHFALLET